MYSYLFIVVYIRVMWNFFYEQWLTKQPPDLEYVLNNNINVT